MRYTPVDGRKPIHASATAVNIELQIPRKYKERTIYKDADTRLAKAKENFKAGGTESFELVTPLNIDCARGARYELLAEKMFNITSMIINSICASNTQLNDDSWQQPIAKRALMYIVKYTRQLEQTNTS
jgi:hypothetical protein